MENVNIKCFTLRDDNQSIGALAKKYSQCIVNSMSSVIWLEKFQALNASILTWNMIFLVLCFVNPIPEDLLLISSPVLVVTQPPITFKLMEGIIVPPCVPGQILFKYYFYCFALHAQGIVSLDFWECGTISSVF